MIALLALIALLLSALPALVFLLNLRLYRPLPPVRLSAELPPVSVLIPARNEARSIRAAVEAVLASRGVELELLVRDDGSTDDTAAIVQAIARDDSRLHLLPGEPLPAGWAGKQHACQVLARSARYDWLVFLDADVHLEPDALARLLGFMTDNRVDLGSGVPQQKTGTFLEQLLIPLIHFLLLGFLPLWRMRASTHPAYGAGCGQLFIARRPAYDQAGGHAAIRTSFHDGLQLPRAFRRAGLRTDLFDASDLARCRMYHHVGEVWSGLAKNAREGLASNTTIFPATLLLCGGQVLPFALLAWLPWLAPVECAMVLAAVVLAWLPRLVGALRFRQSWWGALFHPLGMVLLLAIQWYALVRVLLGRPVAWKGRAPATFPDPAGEHRSSAKPWEDSDCQTASAPR